MDKYVYYIIGIVVVVFVFSLFSAAYSNNITGNVIGLPSKYIRDLPDSLKEVNSVTHEGVTYTNYCLVDEKPEYKYTFSKNMLRMFTLQDGKVNAKWFNCELLKKECSNGICTGKYDPRTIPNQDKFQILTGKP